MSAAITALVAKLKEFEEDFEFYPTTDEIIRVVARDIKSAGHRRYSRDWTSLLDIGAGNGKVLTALRGDDTGIYHLHAIEKSLILCEQLPPDVLIVGTDFHDQSLIEKKTDVTFCNPPYRQYEQWAEKIIRQSASECVYLVIPHRWAASEKIKDALDYRKAETTVLGKYSFADAERKARANVEVVRVMLAQNKDDAFEKFFDDQFSHLKDKFKEKTEPEAKAKARGQLVVGPGYPAALVNLFDQEMAHVEKQYQLVSELDVDLLKEFEINPPSVMKMLRAKLGGLRSRYWKELFDHLDSITDRLTSKSRSTLLDTLHKQVHVDFTVSNICAVVIWVIKNANRFIDSQLIDTYETMVEKCNVHNYKSNQRTWKQNGWRYCADDHTHYKLDYRIVCSRVGGVNSSTYSWEKGLADSGAEFIHNLQVIARNLAFKVTPHVIGREERKTWLPNQLQDIWFNDGADRLFDVKGFKNGNLHIRFHQTFILALNVEHGRLKGWLNTAKEAATELNDPLAARFFNKNKQIMGSEFPMLQSGDNSE